MTKSYILNEIKRTAEANGGQPLGRIRFEKETGIKETHWYGVYWARWGEAVKEAGFVPNEMQGAFDKDNVIRKYADLAKRIGRLPTDADLRLASRNDTEFPTNKTFTSRLGKKAQLVFSVEEYCKSHPEYEDVAEMCRSYVSPKKDDRDGAVELELEFGFVYLMKSGRFYKIGRSNSSGRRGYELAIQLPERATRFMKSELTIQSGSNHTGTNALNPNERMASGLNLTLPTLQFQTSKVHVGRQFCINTIITS